MQQLRNMSIQKIMLWKLTYLNHQCSYTFSSGNQFTWQKQTCFSTRQGAMCKQRPSTSSLRPTRPWPIFSRSFNMKGASCGFSTARGWDPMKKLFGSYQFIPIIEVEHLLQKQMYSYCICIPIHIARSAWKPSPEIFRKVSNCQSKKRCRAFIRIPRPSSANPKLGYGKESANARR